MDSTACNKVTWNVRFLQGHPSDDHYALIILNQPFSRSLLRRLWTSTRWHCCADGGANRLFDTLQNDSERRKYIPDLIKGDLDSLRPEVRTYYENLGVLVVEEKDEDSTDLMKCVLALQDKEENESTSQYHIILLGGLSGRLDQTIHTLSYLHKLRKTRERVFAVTNESIGWVLDSGEHEIEVDHSIIGPTCGLLPVGIDSTVLSTSGLKWNLTDQVSSFEGLVSTSNHLVPGENNVWIKTSKAIWWTAELSQGNAITVLYFAAASSETGVSQEEISIPTDNEFKLSYLPQLLISRYPNSNLDKILKASRWSVDLEMVDEPNQVTLIGGEEVGVICPVSGG